jgi:predicted deacetylase
MAKYLIRLDDITEGTNWKYFNMLEKVFDKYEIKPILGVVPNNQDKSIIDSAYIISRDIFFEKIRKLQSNGYIIAMHGIEHNLKHTDKKSIVNINNYGELVNLSYHEKRMKIRYGKKILEDENIKVDMYMPPAHWIDEDIINILKEENFKYITDGLFIYPKKISNMLFIPQQLWRPRKIFLPGIFTICLHINNNTLYEIENICNFIEKNNKLFIDFNKVINIKCQQHSICHSYNFLIENFLNKYLLYKRVKSNG